MPGNAIKPPIIARIAISAGLLAAAPIGVCNAEVRGTIARCAASESMEDRIVCLENALRNRNTGSPSKPLRNEADDAAVDTLGREQLETRDETDDGDDAIVRATVVEFDFTGYRRLIVRLESGQVWRQIDGDRTSVERGLRNDETFDVELWGTKLGGYRMRVIPLDRTLRVERVK